MYEYHLRRGRLFAPPCGVDAGSGSGGGDAPALSSSSSSLEHAALLDTMRTNAQHVEEW